MTTDLSSGLGEKSLLIKLRSGDQHSFEWLYHQHKARLYGNILRLVKSEDIAEEILQDVFLRIWEKRHLIDPDKSIGSYLFRIARNLVIDFYRKAAVDKELQSNLIAAASELYSHVEDVIYFKESNEIIQKAIESLPPQRRQIFILCKLEGKTYQEVSEILGISASTVNDHIVKATKKVKEHLFRSSDIAFALIVGALLIPK